LFIRHLERRESTREPILRIEEVQPVSNAQSPYASFSRRAFARFIDLWVVLAPCGLLYLANKALGFPLRYTSLFNWQQPQSVDMFMSYDFPGVFIIFTSIKLFLAYPYFALMESSAWQGTFGKQAMRIKVTDMNGDQISFARATARYFLKIISSIEFMLGYLVCFSDQRQTIHDYISRVLVVRKEVVFSAYYAMPRISSRLMFEVPFFSARRDNDRAGWSGFECIWCDYRATEKHALCPNCSRFGYAPIGVVKGMLILAGSIFSLLGCALAYISFWVVSERLTDDRLGRDGAPWTVIFIIFFACGLCLIGGLSSILGKKWLLRLMLWLGLRGRTI
jgi:uncharacterized RDD family membrane protein YckC